MRCCGSISVASGGVMRKISASKSSILSRKNPKREGKEILWSFMFQRSLGTGEITSWVDGKHCLSEIDDSLYVLKILWISCKSVFCSFVEDILPTMIWFWLILCVLCSRSSTIDDIVGWSNISVAGSSIFVICVSELRSSIAAKESIPDCIKGSSCSISFPRISFTSDFTNCKKFRRLDASLLCRIFTFRPLSFLFSRTISE